MSGKYDDIIGLPHPVSKTRPRMSRLARAAQFSPFAALVGYDAAIRETARLTDAGPGHSEETQAVIDRKLRFLANRIHTQPEISVTYFVPDASKDGGGYLTVQDKIKKIDPYAYMLILQDGTKIPFEDIFSIDCELFLGSSD